eukprot:1892491-Rhodomonas_salina.2
MPGEEREREDARKSWFGVPGGRERGRGDRRLEGSLAARMRAEGRGRCDDGGGADGLDRWTDRVYTRNQILHTASLARRPSPFLLGKERVIPCSFSGWKPEDQGDATSVQLKFCRFRVDSILFLTVTNRLDLARDSSLSSNVIALREPSMMIHRDLGTLQGQS